jgi:Domain of unknown function (DUF397)
VEEIAGYKFRRSSFCGTGTCVEVASLENGWVALRDSKNPNAPAHRFDRGEWLAFIRGVRAGEFDFPAPHGVESDTVRLSL